MKKITFFIAMLSCGLAIAQPTTNAPVPTKMAADVKSVFSDTYTSIANDYNPNWGQSGTVNSTFNPTGSGTNLALAYLNFNYQGTLLAAQSLSSMEFLHVDVWSSANPGSSILQVSPINNGSGTPENLVTINYTTGSWYSVDIPKSAFTGMTWDSVYQLKFAANGPGSTTPITVYLDNIYFWKTPVAAGSDATLSDLKVDGTTVAGFSPNTISYTKGLAPGTTAIPQITVATSSDAGAATVITQATAIPGSATVLVTSQSGSVTKTYTVNYVFEGPTTAAPLQPGRAPQDVISLFCNQYTNVVVDTWSADWDDSSVQDVVIAGNDTKKITFANFLGVDFSSVAFNASTMTHFHMDYWTEAPDLTGKIINPKWSNHTNGQETSAFLYTGIVTTSGSWQTIDVPLTTFAGPLTRNNLAQFILTSNLGVVYVDNIYLHNTVLGTTDFVKSSFKMYPNPAKGILNIASEVSIDNITIYNTLGQLVVKQTISSNQESINVSALPNGVYILSAQIGNEVVRKQFIKE